MKLVAVEDLVAVVITFINETCFYPMPVGIITVSCSKSKLFLHHSPVVLQMIYYTGRKNNL